MRRYFLKFKEDPAWNKLLTFCLIIFFIRLADSIIAFWAPNEIQNTLNNSIVMGAIISIQSLVGFLSDLVFPKIFKSVKTRQLLFWAILICAMASFFLCAAAFKPFLAIFIVTMALWGIYYELMNFANFQFMSSVCPGDMRAAGWGFAGVFVNLAYFLGPFIATELLSHGIFITQGMIISFLIAALVILALSRNKHEAPSVIDLSIASPFAELRHWATLSRAIWPALAIGLVLGFIDATFYTVGAVWTEKLSLTNPWGVWFLPMYLLPSICLGIPLSRWNIQNGKKKLAEKFLGLSGIFFIFIVANSSVPWQLAMVCLASSALAVCYPLLEGVYTDFLIRMGSEKKEMIGLTGSVVNFSYIIWPVFAGIISSRVGERLTFFWLGVVVFVCSVILLFVTPKKLKLPQQEIKAWS